MKIEDLCTLWPPLLNRDSGKDFRFSKLDDTVVGAELMQDHFSEFICLTIRTKLGEERTISLRVPANLLAPTLTAIVERLGSSLQVIGAINIR
jgi:hypothetical protein